MKNLFNSAYIFKVDMQERALAGCRRAEAKIFPLEEELDLAGGGPGGGGGGPALHQQPLHLERRRVEKRTLDYDVKPRAGSCRGAPMRARPDLPPRGWKGSPPPVWRAVATHKKHKKHHHHGQYQQ